VTLALERDLLARAKRERAGLRVVWDQALGQIPARRQARLAIELAKVKPVLIQKNGSRIPCEPIFRLTRVERKELATRMLGEGASRNEILATVEISASTLLKLRRAVSPNGHRKWLSSAVETAVSEDPAWLPPEHRGPAVIALDASGPDPEAEQRFRALMRDGELPRMTQAEAERRRPTWHAFVYGSARNPIMNGKRGAR
jgi:hypothetical protein